MRCRKCQREITGPQMKNASIERDDKGRIKAAYHKKCAVIRRKETTEHGSHKGGSYFSDAPSAYDMAKVKHREDIEATKERRAEIEEQEKLEKRPSRWDDWRDPATLEL